MGYSLVAVVIEDSPEPRHEVHLCKSDDFNEIQEELAESFGPLGLRFALRGLVKIKGVTGGDEKLKWIYENLEMSGRGKPDSISGRIAQLMFASFLFGWTFAEESPGIDKDGGGDSSSGSPTPAEDPPKSGIN